ncbi:MAG: ABC transporter substrate-binding protein [Myxococcales bacterium]|jgi:MarR-like DNA-binding transcriptional regulator SgrR of sgrS sRNA
MRRGALAIGLAVSLIGGAAIAGMRAQYGGTLRVAVPVAPQTLDPALAATPADVVAAGLTFDTLVRLGGDGELRAGLAAVPEPEANGRLFRFRLRPSLRFHDGSSATARDVVASLARLEDAKLGSPFAAIALPLAGAGEGGRIGLEVVSDSEVQASLAFPYPDWPRALAHPAAALLRPAGERLVGTGAFRPATGSSAQLLQLVAHDDCPLGRPFVDLLRLVPSNPRSVSRAVSLGEADLAFVTGSSREGGEGPALFATYLAVNEERIGAMARPLREAIVGSVDVAGLTKFFVRAPATPLYGLLPPALDPAAPRAQRPAGRPASLRSGAALTLVCDASNDDHRSVGERLQVKLHDFGVALAVKRLPRNELREALRGGDYDLALVSIAAIPEAGMALAQLVELGAGRDAARELLREVGAGPDREARLATASAQARAWLERLPLLPLYVEVPRLVAREGIAAVGFDGAGVPSIADAWIIGAPAKPQQKAPPGR